MSSVFQTYCGLCCPSCLPCTTGKDRQSYKQGTGPQWGTTVRKSVPGVLLRSQTHEHMDPLQVSRTVLHPHGLLHPSSSPPHIHQLPRAGTQGSRPAPRNLNVQELFCICTGATVQQLVSSPNPSFPLSQTPCLLVAVSFTEDHTQVCCQVNRDTGSSVSPSPCSLALA